MIGAATKVAGGGSCGRFVGRALMRAATAILLLAFAAPVAAIAANSTDGLATASGMGLSTAPIKPGERMLVESDQLVYDYDNNTVAAVGNVKIYYGGYTLEAEKVSYNKTSGRLIASGHVKLVDPTGSAFYTDYIDITDDFSKGFVQSLRVDTAQRTHFGAESAERGDDKTTFVNGTYTACEPCKDHPERPPLWNVRAAKIVFDHQAHTVYFTDAKLEFLGLPVAWMPYFAVADPTVKRKSGFLAPTFGYADKLGFFGSLPYYWSIAPNKDITFTPTYLTRQGFMGQLEWRHRLSNGEYAVKVAGINQNDPAAFPAGSPGRAQSFRGGVRTTGKFYLNQDWTLGWDATLQTDRTFTRDYGVLNGNTDYTESTIHLTGIRDRNFFEARSSYFQVLTDQSGLSATTAPQYNQGRQAIVVPEIDSTKYVDHPVLGGEMSFKSNLTVLNRQEDDPFQFNAMAYPLGTTYTHGTAGTFTRLTKEVDWQRRFIGPMGQVITPFAYLRGDAFFLSGQSTAADGSPGLTSDSTAFRFMPAVGVDWSLPILATAPGATHIIEPRVQLIVRPDEMHAGTLPNNDAQSLVFDPSNLFTWDKFSGYDREEGGTRLNVGLHYNGSFDSGASVDATVGRSYQLAGTNPYATQDLAGVGGSLAAVGIAGSLSGLDTTASDYVAGATVDTGLGPRISANGRFDDADLSVNRGEVEATAAFGAVSASTAYLYLRNNPYSSTLGSASVIRGAASVNLSDNWRAFGTAVYDIGAASLAGNSLGLAFDNECVTFAVAYSEMRDDANTSRTRWLNFRLQLRTIGDSGLQTNLSKTN